MTSVFCSINSSSSYDLCLGQIGRALIGIADLEQRLGRGDLHAQVSVGLEKGARCHGHVLAADALGVDGDGVSGGVSGERVGGGQGGGRRR